MDSEPLPYGHGSTCITSFLEFFTRSDSDCHGSDWATIRVYFKSCTPRCYIDCMRRRRFLISATGAALLKGAASEPQTFVYKKAGGCELHADVFGSGTGARKPVAVWIHGGALIQGSRKL